MSNRKLAPAPARRVGRGGLRRACVEIAADAMRSYMLDRFEWKFTTGRIAKMLDDLEAAAVMVKSGWNRHDMLAAFLWELFPEVMEEPADYAARKDAVRRNRKPSGIVPRGGCAGVSLEGLVAFVEKIKAVKQPRRRATVT